jgi:hypothetical protein
MYVLRMGLDRIIMTGKSVIYGKATADKLFSTATAQEPNNKAHSMLSEL